MPCLPCNALTRRTYSGVNILILWEAVIEAGYASQCWMTFKQALEAGGCVRKGERGTTVVYADRFVPEAERTRAERDGEDARSVPFLKRFTVFNVAQCDGLPGSLATDPAPLPERELVPTAEALIAGTGADFRVGGSKACYVPSADYIQVPPQPAFFHPIDYYRTAFHELTHNAAIRIMPHDLCGRLVFPGIGHAAVRHNQSPSRNARSWSSGRNRPDGVAGAVTRASAFSFIRMSAWM